MNYLREDVGTLDGEFVEPQSGGTSDATVEYDPTPDHDDDAPIDPVGGAYKPVSQQSDEELASFADRVASDE
jgi:hypothetical protein